MITIDREDYLEQEELYDDFNRFGLPMLPRIHRGIARPYYPKRRKRRINRRGIAPISRPKRRRPTKGAMSILLPRRKAIKFGKPRRTPLKRSPILKVSPPTKLPKSKKKTPAQRASPRSSAKIKAKALKQEITQKNGAPQKPKDGMSTQKKLIIIGLTIATVTITGYLIYNAQKNKTQ